MLTWLQSRRVRYLAGVCLLFWLLMIALRVIFLLGFSEVGDTIQTSGEVLAKSLYIGFKFDLRLALLLCLPLILLAYIPRLNLVRVSLLRHLAWGYVLIAVSALLVFYVFDFGHYAYLGVRINSTAMRFFEDFAISRNMVWESYPVVWITLGVISTVILFLAAYRVLVFASLLRPQPLVPVKSRIIGGFTLFFATVLGILGQWPGNIENPVPLRWSDAFFSGSTAIASLGLNPVLYFADSYEYEEAPYEKEKVEHYYSDISVYLGVKDPNPEQLNYLRQVPANKTPVSLDGKQPNVVFIMLESLGASRLGIYNNPLKPSPNLDRIAREGWFMPNFYVPVSGTARTVFASLTGLADVTRVNTASRNTLIIDQTMIINEFKDYDKKYFIGGNLGWANMSAVINHNIPDIEIFEEGSFSSPNVDVWGISDLDLFKETDKVLSQLPKERPFFAYIQTAANHRPFTVPDNNDDFEVDLSHSDEALSKAGFKSEAQYNAVRLLDYNIGRFMEMAKAGGYFDNTIFVLYGDHNNRITETPHMKPFYEALDLDGLHVPNMIYAPKLLKPRVIEETVSLVDMFPTVAGLVGIPYRNNTMGRDISQPAPEGERVVYTQTSHKTRPVIGAITKDFMLRIEYNSDTIKLHDLNSPTPAEDVSEQHPAMTIRLTRLAKGIYESTRYLLHNNGERDIPK
ncbi:LTA synthase family protein [Aestuariirhabdus sp. Z084]|uniref:LTA synthase family protein n=1 Tax=Aestuariirhabdus haliotis TaxID=2918751 RepID=UPI00201B4619|nr:LTA synthase family protein [Aestuariirhabdus haliotis]MCL6414651.1 LTA synthase family protein [Aestuariirhabdus haliotis]MCL6418367.1 LTA synthase family protein [Aestuariirhabdus haliotis]